MLEETIDYSLLIKKCKFKYGYPTGNVVMAFNVEGSDELILEQLVDNVSKLVSPLESYSELPKDLELYHVEFSTDLSLMDISKKLAMNQGDLFYLGVYKKYEGQKIMETCIDEYAGCYLTFKSVSQFDEQKKVENLVGLIDEYNGMYYQNNYSYTFPQLEVLRIQIGLFRHLLPEKYNIKDIMGLVEVNNDYSRTLLSIEVAICTALSKEEYEKIPFLNKQKENIVNNEFYQTDLEY